MDANSAFNFDATEMEVPITKREWKVYNRGLKDGFLIGCKTEQKRIQKEIIDFLGLFDYLKEINRMKELE